MCGDGVMSGSEECECEDMSTDCRHCTNCMLDQGKVCSPDSSNLDVQTCCGDDGMHKENRATCTTYSGAYAGYVGMCHNGKCAATGCALLAIRADNKGATGDMCAANDNNRLNNQCKVMCRQECQPRSSGNRCGKKYEDTVDGMQGSPTDFTLMHFPERWNHTFVKDYGACKNKFNPYCNEDNTWCGVSPAHRDAQPSNTYDFNDCANVWGPDTTKETWNSESFPGFDPKADVCGDYSTYLIGPDGGRPVSWLPNGSPCKDKLDNWSVCAEEDGDIACVEQDCTAVDTPYPGCKPQTCTGVNLPYPGCITPPCYPKDHYTTPWGDDGSMREEDGSVISTTCANCPGGMYP